jgi:hypothetical protein
VVEARFRSILKAFKSRRSHRHRGNLAHHHSRRYHPRLIPRHPRLLQVLKGYLTLSLVLALIRPFGFRRWISFAVISFDDAFVTF